MHSVRRVFSSSQPTEPGRVVFWRSRGHRPSREQSAADSGTDSSRLSHSQLLSLVFLSESRQGQSDRCEFHGNVAFSKKKYISFQSNHVSECMMFSIQVCKCDVISHTNEKIVNTF